jgi:hypothetical protein
MMLLSVSLVPVTCPVSLPVMPASSGSLWCLGYPNREGVSPAPAAHHPREQAGHIQWQGLDRLTI